MEQRPAGSTGEGTPTPTCSACGERAEPGARFCEACGQELDSATMIVPPRAVEPLDSDPSPEPNKLVLILVLLLWAGLAVLALWWVYGSAIQIG